DEMAGIHTGIGAGLRSGILKPVVGREFDLADAASAHEAVMSPGAFGKIVLRTREDGSATCGTAA
ncbi:MAG: hypothetical protein EHM13_11835, partial [Acidobacteria bacterium]